MGCKPRNRARVLDKPVTDTSIPFRRDNLIEGGGGRGKEREASFHDPVATLDNARIDDQPSQQKSWETERETNSTMHPRVYVGSFCEGKYLVLSFILENSRGKGEFLQGM